MSLCETLGNQLGADMEVVAAAAWLHDIVKRHSAEPPEVPDAELAAVEAYRVLQSTDFPPDKIDAVCLAIRVHEGLIRDRPVQPLEAAVLWDADKLSKLGATYLVHSLCIRPAFDPIFEGRPTDTDLVLRSLDGWLQMGERIVASMNTQPGRIEGSKRLAFLRRFVAELRSEWNRS